MRKSEREELVDFLIMSAFVSCSNPAKPGVVVQRLLSKYGEKIRQLTSEDFRDTRVDWMKGN